MDVFKVLPRIGLLRLRFRFKAGMTGAMSVKMMLDRPRRDRPIPAGPQPVPSSMPRLLVKSVRLV